MKGNTVWVCFLEKRKIGYLVKIPNFGRRTRRLWKPGFEGLFGEIEKNNIFFKN